MSQSITEGHNNSVHITRWEPDGGVDWSDLIDQNSHANLAQAPEWYTAIHHAYGHLPLYLQGEDCKGRVAILPSFLIRNQWLGTMVSSMPFLDTGGPCSPTASMARLLVEALVHEAIGFGARIVELRCSVGIELPVAAMMDKVSLVLPLPSDPGDLWRHLSAKVRNQVRKAERCGLSIEFGGMDKLDDFYEVFAMNMRDLGSPVHGRMFFRAILETFDDRAMVALVRYGTTPIGGLIALALKDTLVVPWASSLREYRSLCPNMLMYWEVLSLACTEGFRRFDFGRSSRHSNTYRFKRQWGAIETPLFWYTLSTGHSSMPRLLGTSRVEKGFIELWKRLPLSVASWIGPRIRKYLTQ
jgi:FemAB-related protein (PEP-CTERM system-associated)